MFSGQTALKHDDTLPLSIGATWGAVHPQSLDYFGEFSPTQLLTISQASSSFFFFSSLK